MNHPIKILYCLFPLFLSNQVVAQPDKFSTPAIFNDLHTVYTYQKSNWDGTHASTIFLYVRNKTQLESFKWAEGDEWATLVSADMDWKSFTIKGFKNHRIFRNGTRRLLAELHENNQHIHFKVGDFADSMQLENAFWHSYDFDFAGLGFSWRALNNKRSDFYFHIADAGMTNDKISFLNKGRVDVKYAVEENLNGKPCLKYAIDGPGLQYKGGHIWINPLTNMIELYKIELPDEDGFANGQLKLMQSQKMSPAEWEKFITSKMSL